MPRAAALRPLLRPAGDDLILLVELPARLSSANERIETGHDGEAVHAVRDRPVLVARSPVRECLHHALVWAALAVREPSAAAAP